MGMCFGMVTLSDTNIRRVLADPPQIWRVLAPEDPEAYENERKSASTAGGFLARLFGKPAPQQPGEDVQLGDGEGEVEDLDKSWHGIHYMLTKTAWEGPEPLNFIAVGGQQVGNVEVGYGTARVLTSSQVIAINNALRPIDEEYLKRRFDPADMKRLDIYPDIWERDPADDDALGYCIEYFETMKAFISKAVERDMGLVVYLS